MRSRWRSGEYPQQYHLLWGAPFRSNTAAHQCPCQSQTSRSKAPIYTSIRQCEDSSEPLRVANASAARDRPLWWLAVEFGGVALGMAVAMYHIYNTFGASPFSLDTKPTQPLPSRTPNTQLAAMIQRDQCVDSLPDSKNPSQIRR